MENIEQRVRKIIAEQLGVNEAEIKNESSFVDDLGADSLDTVELVMALEEEFETEIPDEEAPRSRPLDHQKSLNPDQPRDSLHDFHSPSNHGSRPAASNARAIRVSSRSSNRRRVLLSPEPANRTRQNRRSAPTQGTSRSMPARGVAANWGFESEVR